MRENWTLPKTFAQIVNCREDSSSLMELNYGEYENYSRMTTFQDEFPFDPAVPLTVVDVFMIKVCKQIIPMVLLFVAAMGADQIGRRQMTVYVCSLLFGLGCFCCNQTFVGYIWASGLWFFESKTSELLCQYGATTSSGATTGMLNVIVFFFLPKRETKKPQLNIRTITRNQLEKIHIRI